MSDTPDTLGTALPKEIERVMGVLKHYDAIGPAGLPGAFLIKQDIARAHKAIMEGDLPGMIVAYKALQGCQ